MIQNIGTDRPKQTVQTQIRLVLKHPDTPVSPKLQASYTVCW